MSEVSPDWIDVGEVTAPQGVRGELRVLPYVEETALFQPGRRLYAQLRTRRTTLDVQRMRPHGRLLLLKAAGVEGRAEAEALRGARLQLPPAELAPLPQGSYYVYQLKGLKVIDESGESLGVVADVIETGANDVYVVRRSGARDLLLPATRECIREVDIASERMVVRLLPGLREL